jgi:hypothetical protein
MTPGSPAPPEEMSVFPFEGVDHRLEDVRVGGCRALDPHRVHADHHDRAAPAVLK